MISIGAILAFAAAYWRVIAGLALIFLTLIAIVHWWDRVRFLATRVWYATPVIGKTARLAKNTGMTTALGGRGWFQSEKELCDAFHSHLEKIVADPAMYDRAQSYLTKVHEIGRSPLSVGGGALIFILIFIESLGFAYVLAGYTLPGASEALQIPGAFLIAILISILLVFLTHMSGYEWHKRGLVRMARQMWVHDDEEAGRPGNLIVQQPARLDIDEADNSDKVGKDQKPYLQLLRRLQVKSTEPGIPWLNIFTVIVIGAVAVGAFTVRYQTYERDQTCQTLNGTQSSEPNIFSGIPSSGATQPALPPVITEPQRENESAGQNQQCSHDRAANVSTYVVLAFVFIGVQLIGWYMGYSKSFAGRESRKAWRKLAGFDDKVEYENWYERERDRIMNISQRHLSNLQSKLSRQVQTRGVSGQARVAISDSGSRTFEDYEDQRAKRRKQSKNSQKAEHNS